MTTIKAVLFPPLHRQGLRFLIIFALITLILWAFSDFFGVIGLGMTIWCYYFFRDPVRVVPQKEGLVISPADGVICKIDRDIAAPDELGLDGQVFHRISIFMNVFNCHVNRFPVAGRVSAVSYYPGVFFNASLDKASIHNERNAIALEAENGQNFAMVQIAGFVARRIVCDVKPQDTGKAGDRFGIIRFGSRVDLYIPQHIQPLVAVGQKTVAGETVIADCSIVSGEDEITFAAI